MILSIDGVEDTPVDAHSDFSELLKRVNGHDSSFAILAKSEHFYIQTHCDGLEYVLEKREGHDDAHYSAVRERLTDPLSRPKKWWQFWKRRGQQTKFPFDVIVEQFANYAFDTTSEAPVYWEKMEMVK